jgi:hypothetical protein
MGLPVNAYTLARRLPWKMRRSLKHARKRVVGAPFQSRSSRKLVIHCCHHKVGTVWFQTVLRRVAEHWGLAYQSGTQANVSSESQVFLEYTSQVDVSKWPPFRGSHIIRDPRDVIVSGYFHHRRCTEPWALAPDERFGGRSFQEHLLSLSLEDGLAAEMTDGFAPITIRDMKAWDYHNPAFLELRYEEFIANESDHWVRLFRHYGFRDSYARKSALIAARYSLASPGYRARRSGHVRSGRAGDWREHFNASHRRRFRELYGDVLQVLGYEDNDDWVTAPAGETPALRSSR